MQKLVQLLKEKNHFLAKFCDLNESELANFADGDFNNVETFYGSRERVLDIIRCIDALIDDEMGRTSNDEVTAQIKEEIQSILREKDMLAREILAQDLRVLAAIEAEKSNIIRELQQSKANRRVISADRSGPAAPQLDEEA